VDRIGKSITGEVQLDLTHFPVDAARASVVAQEVNAATGSGLLLPTGLSGITCDVNSSADTSVPVETFTEGTFPDYGSNLGGFNESGLGDQPVDNPEDGLSGQSTPSGAQPTLTSDGDINSPSVGDTLTAPTICAGGQIVFYRLDPTVEGGRVFLGGGPTYTLVINDVDYSVYSETRFPDPSASDGYGEPITSAPTGPVTDEFIATPSTITVNYTLETYSYSSAKLDCSSGNQTTPENIQSNVSTGSVANVVSYRPLTNVVISTFVCSGSSSIVEKMSGVQLMLADGSTSLIGALAPDEIVAIGVSGINRTYRQVYLTYGAGIFLYDSPPIPDPPNPLP
jgi:hypothetical protein